MAPDTAFEGARPVKARAQGPAARDPAPVRGARGRRDLGGPVRGAPVQPARGAASRARGGRAHPEVDPPAELPPGEVVVIQSYGSLFFAAAIAFEAALPTVTSGSRSRAVIVRLRGRSELGVTFIDVLARCAASLEAVGSRLLLVSTNERIGGQVAATRIDKALGAGSVYPGGERVGAALERAWADADAWVASRPAAGLPS